MKPDADWHPLWHISSDCNWCLAWRRREHLVHPEVESIFGKEERTSVDWGRSKLALRMVLVLYAVIALNLPCSHNNHRRHGYIVTSGLIALLAIIGLARLWSVDRSTNI
jgi:hypothetical protein